MKKDEKCVICGCKIIGHGNNPRPIADHGKVCDICNAFVVLRRIQDMQKGEYRK